MESCVIKLKVLSCKDLKAFNFFQKLSVYALVSLYSDDPDKKLEKNQEQRTPADTEGDGNPEWNREMQFDLSEFSIRDFDHLFLKFDLRHLGFMFGENQIGDVRVSLKDLMQQPIVRFVSYEVRGGDGKPNGVLNFSYQVTGKGKFMDAEAGSPSPHITGFPIGHHHHHHHTPEVQYPPLGGHSELTQQSLYPSLDIGDIYPEPCVNYAAPGSYYPPPPPNSYFLESSHMYPPPPPPPQELPWPPAPPPPHVMPAGGYYPPPGPSTVYHWGSEQYAHLYGYGSHGSQGTVVGHQHHSMFSDREMSRDGRHG